jgi:hypothetical protein
LLRTVCLKSVIAENKLGKEVLGKRCKDLVDGRKERKRILKGKY